MSLTKAEKTEKNLYTLEFSVDHDTFEAAVSKVFRARAKNIQVPGFRKGKAPRSVVEKLYGKSFFYEDAINEVLPDAYVGALKEAAIDAVGRPAFDIVSIDENGVVLSAKVAVKPEVTIENYKGIEVEKVVTETTDAEIENEINTVRERNSREIEVTDRAVEAGDTVKIDYEGFADGKAFEGGKAEGYNLKIGSGSFIPGFEDQIIGHTIGEKFDINVTFPTEYHAKDLAGKAVVFKIKLLAITKVELPALDDDFAKDVSEFNTLDEYRADVKAKITKRHETEADNAFAEAVAQKLKELLVADIPEAMYEEETENEVRDYDNRLRAQGLDLGTYFKYTGLNLDTLRAQLRPRAEDQVKVRLALEKIAELEALAPSADEIEEEYKRIAEAYGMEIEKVKEMVEEKAIADDMKVKKAMDLVKDAAVAKKPKKTAKKAAAAETAEGEEKPAKKTAKKAAAPAEASEGEEKPAKRTTKKAPAKKETNTEDKAE